MVNRFTIADQTDTGFTDHTEQTTRSTGDEGQSLAQESQHAHQTIVILAKFLRAACQLENTRSEQAATDIISPTTYRSPLSC